MPYCNTSWRETERHRSAAAPQPAAPGFQADSISHRGRPTPQWTEPAALSHCRVDSASPLAQEGDALMDSLHLVSLRECPEGAVDAAETIPKTLQSDWDRGCECNSSFSLYPYETKST